MSDRPVWIECEVSGKQKWSFRSFVVPAKGEWMHFPDGRDQVSVIIKHRSWVVDHMKDGYPEFRVILECQELARNPS